MSHSILFMTFGQSNADCHDAGPAYDVPVFDDPRIVLPNDGFGFRGTIGRTTTQPIDGFVPSYGFSPKVQSSGVAAAARYLNALSSATPDDMPTQVIVRSAAKGGRPFIGYLKDDREIAGIFKAHTGAYSQIFQNLLIEIKKIAAVTRAQGAPLRHVFLPFFHGEADRATDRDVYTSVATEMMDIVDQTVHALGITSHWLLTQPSGTAPTHGGNAWANRMSVLEIATQRPNAHFASANYALTLADAAHLSAESKVIAGELIGLTAARIVTGQTDQNRPVLVQDITATGNEITVTFDTDVPLALDQSAFPSPKMNFGFQVAQQAPDFVTDATVIDGTTLRLTCAGPVPVGVTLNYAFASQKRQDPGKDVIYPFGRGCLREMNSLSSCILEDKSLKRWVPAFSVPIQEAVTLARAA